MSTYLYRNRPPSIGCQPDGFTGRETWMPAKKVHDRHFLGKVIYDEPLTQYQAWSYELFPVDTTERAEMVFHTNGVLDEWLRDDYCSQEIDFLLGGIDFDQKARAALILKGHQPTIDQEPSYAF